MKSAGDVVDPVFLPFTVAELIEHMPPRGAVAEDRPDRWAHHFVGSARRYRKFLESYPEAVEYQLLQLAWQARSKRMNVSGPPRPS